MYTIKTIDNIEYIVFDKKYKGEDIVVKLNSNIEAEVVELVSDNTSTTIHRQLNAYIDIINKDGLYIRLRLLNDTEEVQYSFTTELTEDIITEFYNAVVDNKRLDMFVKKINDLYTTAFISLLNNNVVLMSSKLINVVAKVYKDDVNLGTAARFIYSKNDMTLLEYVGKAVEGCLNIEIEVDGIKVELIALCKIEEEKVHIGHINLIVTTFEIEKKERYKLIQMRNINLCNKLLNSEQMVDYIYKNNSQTIISNFMATLKPQVIKSNINLLMLKEFFK